MIGDPIIRRGTASSVLDGYRGWYPVRQRDGGMTGNPADTVSVHQASREEVPASQAAKTKDQIGSKAERQIERRPGWRYRVKALKCGPILTDQPRYKGVYR